MVDLRLYCKSPSSLLSLIMVMSLVSFWGHVSADEVANIPEAQMLNLKDMDGNKKNLHDYQIEGKWLVAMIWQSDCHICNQEAQSYVAWFEKNRSGNSTLMGISTDGWDGRQAAQGFIDKHKVTFPNTLISYEALNEYYANLVGQAFIGTPSFLVYAPSGELMATQSGAVPTKLIDQYILKNN